MEASGRSASRRPALELSKAPLLQLQDLSKCYRGASAIASALTLGRASRSDFLALNGVSLTVRSGEIVGLLGPNGSGKTTLLRCAAGLLSPDKGRVTVNGEAPSGLHSDVRAQIGLVMREDRTFHHRLTAEENLALFARLQHLGGAKRKQAIERVIRLAEVQDFRAKPYRTFSAGMRARLAFARALLAEPKLLLLDEATSGLDPGLRVTLQRTIRRLADDEGIAILVATHDLDEAESLCDRVAVLEKGAIVAEGLWADTRDDALRVFGLPTTDDEATT